MAETLANAFKERIKYAISKSKVATVITEGNVYQEGDLEILPVHDEMVEKLALPGSGLSGLDNLEELLEKAKSGKSCLLLLEHYSNFDLSIFSYLVRKAGGRGEEIGKSLISIAGMKLNEDNPVVAALASAFTRIVIYPSRSLQSLDPEKDSEEILKGKAINLAAMKALVRHKYKGHLILVFPSGTRYRSWDPETKRGTREIDSYIRTFDYMCCVALNGQILHVQKTDMMNDLVGEDIVRVTAGKVFSCQEFREKACASCPEDYDKKQAVADAIMNELERMHIDSEEERKKLLS